MHIEHDCYHRLFLDIGRQMDVDSLHKIIYYVVYEVYAECQCKLYIRGRSGAFYLFKESEHTAKPPSDADLSILQSIHEDQAVMHHTEKHGSQYIVPLYIHAELVGVVILSGSNIQAYTSEMDVLLTAYKDRLTLMVHSTHDPLTGLYNRQAFNQILGHILEQNSSPYRRSEESWKTWCFVMVDIDHFKLINDRFGHLYGDEVLILLTRYMKEAFRDEDLLFRYGGEEFSIALKNLDLEQAVFALDRFRKRIEDTEFPQVGKVTISMGYATAEGAEALSNLVEQADQALYYAKEHGRNRVCCFNSLIEAGEIKTATTVDEDIELF